MAPTFDLSAYSKAERFSQVFSLGMGASGLVLVAYLALFLGLAIGEWVILLVGGVFLFLGGVTFASPATSVVIDPAGFELRFTGGRTKGYRWNSVSRSVEVLDYRFGKGGVPRPANRRIGSGLRIMTGWQSRSYLTPESFEALLESARLAGCRVEVRDERKSWGWDHYLVHPASTG